MVGACQVGDDVRRRCDAWLEELTARLAEAGLAKKKAADSAALLISLLEGAQVVCRAVGDIEQFDAAARAARSLVK